MNFYTNTHKYYCGVDLHAKSMYVCVVNQEGKVLVHRNIRNDGEYFLKLLAPYREDVVVAVECMFAWYWLADLCNEHKIAFVLGHALYMKAIHGGKAKNDKIDSHKIAVLTKGGMLPTSYVYPKEMRSARDLMRRRSFIISRRSELVGQIQLSRIQYNLPSFEKEIRNRHGGVREGITNYFSDPFVKASVAANSEMIDVFDSTAKKLESIILKAAKSHDPQSLRILQTVWGIGPILSLTILYEIHTIERFPRVHDFLSYSRLVKCQKESAGKNYGSSGKKIGNVYLKWAFSEAAVLFILGNKPGMEFLQKLERQHGKGKALGILAARLGKAVYFMLKKKQSFDMNKFLKV